MMRFAVADLGTNTFHLLVAEAGSDPGDGPSGRLNQPQSVRLDPDHSNVRLNLNILHDEKVAVGLGRGGINQGQITPAAIDRALQCMKYFSEIIHSFGIKQGHAIGTSAMRSALNGKELADRIQLQSLFHVEIIDGITEAGYIYDGVRASGALDNTPGLIVDIGGGSVEFIIGNQDEILWKKSVEIGGLRLLEKFQQHDPMLSEEIEHMQHYFDEQLSELEVAIQQYTPRYLVGSSGVFDTMTEMELAYTKSSKTLKDHSRFDISESAFERMYREIILNNRAERLLIPGMRELRVDMIVVAMVLVRYLSKKYQLIDMRACMYALKEGAMMRLIAASH